MCLPTLNPIPMAVIVLINGTLTHGSSIVCLPQVLTTHSSLQHGHWMKFFELTKELKERDCFTLPLAIFSLQLF